MSTKIYAIRYGSSVRKRSESFIGGDPHDQFMEMAYYIWVIELGDRIVVVDTGFDPAVAEQRARKFIQCPGETMRQLGLDPARVSDVILTHLHYDHAGNHHLFPQAQFHIQAREMRYVTGAWMTFKHLRLGYGASDIKIMIDRLFDDRLAFHDGDSQIGGEISLYRIGGHTKGLMAVGVQTQRGLVVLASDAAVFYEGLRDGRPFPAAFHVGDELAGYRRLLELAGDIDHVIPGHDVEVMRKYPVAIEGLAWRVDLEPTP